MILMNILVSMMISFNTLFFINKKEINFFSWKKIEQIKSEQNSSLEKKVIPDSGFVLDIGWPGFGKKLIDAGVIDKQALEDLYQERDGLGLQEKRLLSDNNINKIQINQQNANFLLNLFWALGLANKNTVLESGPMQEKGDPARYASTGGWNLAHGNVMEHYSKHNFIELNAQQQILVEKISKSIFRPCCDNSTYFPDCNHGMAMLGLIELLASHGKTGDEIFQIALKVNSYWFPDAYLAIAQYFADREIDWHDINPQKILSFDFSSSEGFSKIRSKVKNLPKLKGGSCAV